MRITAEPRSDQWNADDFIGGPRTFTIAGVKPGSAEQKYDIELVEGQGRAWRPPLTVLRLLLAAWGDDATAWQGRRVTLYRDEKVRFGPESVGGIRVSHMSDLPGGKPLTVRLTTSRGKKSPVTVQPLTSSVTQPLSEGASDGRSEPTEAEVKASTDLNELRDWHRRSGPERQSQIAARAAEIQVGS